MGDERGGAGRWRRRLCGFSCLSWVLQDAALDSGGGKHDGRIEELAANFRCRTQFGGTFRALFLSGSPVASHR